MFKKFPIYLYVTSQRRKSFKLKLIKSIVQSTMSKDRWINLIISPMEHEYAKINFDRITYKFAKVTT